MLKLRCITERLAWRRGMTNASFSDWSKDRLRSANRFRARALAGAHKTLPLPCRIKVTNLENGKTAKLRLNDRGPYVGTRMLDVTPRTASKLGFKDKGLTRVHIEVLSVGDGKWRRKR